MRSIAPLTLVAVLTAVAVAATGCGGSDGNSLVGTWKETGVRDAMLVRFDEDGKWVVDADGSLEDGVFGGGTYELEGGHLSIAFGEGGICRGETLEWDIAFTDDDTMDVDVLDGGCNLEEGPLTLLRVDGS